MMQQCDKYLNGVPTQGWLASIVTQEVDDFIMIGFCCDYYTATIPTICIENKVSISKITDILRKHGIGILWTHTIGHYNYIAFSRSSFEN